jgi:hypothetical protein
VPWLVIPIAARPRRVGPTRAGVSQPLVSLVIGGSFLAPFWCLPTMLLSGSSSAVGIALENAIGNVGGFVGPTVVGFLRTETGGDSGAFVSLAAMRTSVKGYAAQVSAVGP